MTKPGYGGKVPRKCVVHGGEEMFDPCAGGGERSRGYCDAWDGTVVGAVEVKPGVTQGGTPGCRWQGTD